MDPMHRMFIVGLTVPTAATAIVAVTLWPNSLWEWLAVAATPFAASAVVALAYAYRNRGPVPAPTTSRRRTSR